jgi:hypothetical protein
VWHDLVLGQLPIALRRARGDVAGGLPLVDACAHKIGDHCLTRLNVIAFAGSGDKLGAFDLRLALGAGQAMPAPFALSGFGIAHVDDDGPVTGRPFA